MAKTEQVGKVEKPPLNGSSARPRIIATYDYTDESGKPLYQVVRFDPKDFRQRRHDGNGGWVYNLEGVRRVLYNRPELAQAPPDSLIFVVEGEKDADNLKALGLLVTTCAMGAGKWRPEYSESLSGQHVVIIPDNDKTGKAHGEAVANALEGKAASVKIIELPVPEKGDISDWLEAGGTVEELLALANRGDAWEPPGSRIGKTMGFSSMPEQEAKADWDPPVPLGEAPTVEPFPVDVFPASLREYIFEGATAMNCPPDYFGLPMLAIAGGCIGNSRWLSITRTHEQSPALYACVIGSKSTVKSPALKKVRDPLDRAQKIQFRSWKKDKEKWENGDEEERGNEPVLRRSIVGDTTTESLSIILDENPRGLCLVRDEVSGLLASLNQYKSGGGHDRQWFLELWSHTLSPRDRRSDKGPPVFLERPLVSIIGSTQPDVVRRFRGDSIRGVVPPDDGFLDRWLFAFPNELPAQGENWLEISPESVASWEQCVDALLALEMVDDGDGVRPFFIRLDPDAKHIWEGFTSQIATEINLPDSPDYLRGYFGKLRGYTGRLSLILHILRGVTNETSSVNVDGESITRAVKLVRYFQSHVRKVFMMMDMDTRVEKARKILGWIDREKRTEFKKWEVHKDLESKNIFPTLDALDLPLELLETHNFIRQREPGQAQRVGRKSGIIFEVNPKSSGESGKSK